MPVVTIPLATIRAAIFDMDGTMINNMAYHKKAWQAFLKRYTITLSDEDFKRKISGKKNDRIFEIAFGRKLSPEETARYTEEKEALYRQLYKPAIAEIAGLSQVIEQLQARGIKTAIATTAPAKNRDFALEALGLAGKFEVILGDEHVEQGKPHPEIYLSAAQQLGAMPSECLVFEDSPPGVESGKRAGMTVVGILSSHRAEELRGADYLVDDFTQLNFS